MVRAGRRNRDDCSVTADTRLEDDDIRDRVTEDENRARVMKSLDSAATLSAGLSRGGRARSLKRGSLPSSLARTSPLRRAGTTRTRFIFRRLWKAESVMSAAAGGDELVLDDKDDVVVVFGFMVGMTIRSVMCFLDANMCSMRPPQFLTQFSPVMKLLPFPPQPLYLHNQRIIILDIKIFQIIIVYCPHVEEKA